MPSTDAHIAASRRNKVTMQHLIALENDEVLPWVVVTAFYSALHAVEAMLDSDPGAPQKHCPDHCSRHQVLKSSNRYTQIWKHYRKLYEASMIARYLSFDSNSSAFPNFSDYLSRSQVQSSVVDHWLAQVEKSVSKLGGISLD